MYNIYEYLKVNKDISFQELEWNVVDYLLCSILSYAPISSFEKKNWNEFVYKILNNSIEEKNFMTPMVFKIINILKNTKRYELMLLYDFINYKDNKTQFGAMTIKINKLKIISFKGTDGSVIGWLENFRLAYLYPTYTQNLALDYLKKNIKLLDYNVYVIGHSKGGNMAMSSVMELNKFKFFKVKQVYNFDGPGFREKEFKSIRYQNLSKKLTNIIPTGSYIGSLLYNENYHIIKTSSHAINEHFPIYWNLKDNMFIDGKFSKLSNELHKRTTISLSKLEEEKVKDIFESAFKIYDERETTKMQVGFKDIINIIKSIRTMDKELSSYILTIIKTMFILSTNKNNIISNKND